MGSFKNPLDLEIIDRVYEAAWAALDREGLIGASCECYQLVRMRTAFHLPNTYP